MRVSATDLKNRLGQYLDSSQKEPVIVEKSGRASAVILSFDEYEKLSQYEDYYWGKLAEEAEKSGYLGVKKTTLKLKEYAKKAGIEIDDENR